MPVKISHRASGKSSGGISIDGRDEAIGIYARMLGIPPEEVAPMIDAIIEQCKARKELSASQDNTGKLSEEIPVFWLNRSFNLDKGAKDALKTVLGKDIKLYQFREFGEDISGIITATLLYVTLGGGAVAYMRNSLSPRLEEIADLAQTVLLYEDDGTFGKVGDEFRFGFQEWDFRKKNGKKIR